MSGFQEELHPRDEGGRFADTAATALERVRGQEGRGGGTGAVQYTIDRAYARNPAVTRGTEPNTADILSTTIRVYGETEDAEIAVYRGPDGKEAGYVLTSGSPPGYIESVAIDESMRGQGLGSAMYDHLQDSGKMDIYSMIGRSNGFTEAGKAFAIKWLESRIARGL